MEEEEKEIKTMKWVEVTNILRFKSYLPYFMRIYIRFIIKLLQLFMANFLFGVLIY